MINRERLFLKLSKELSCKFIYCDINEGYLVVNNNYHLVVIPTDIIWERYSSDENYEQLVDSLVGYVKQVSIRNVEYDKVYPILIDSNNTQYEWCVRKNLFLDIDIIYTIVDGEDTILIPSDANYDEEKLSVSAIQNISKIYNPLIQINENLPIYMLTMPGQFNGAMLLSEITRKQIMNLVGKDFIFAIPNRDTILVAPAEKEYIEILKILLKENQESENKVSDRIYLYWKNQYEYAEQN